MATLQLGLHPTNIDLKCPGAIAEDQLQWSSLSLQRAYDLADRILALDEPWRTRFVELISGQSPDQLMEGSCCPRAGLVAHLSDERVYRFVRFLVQAWTHKELCMIGPDLS